MTTHAHFEIALSVAQIAAPGSGYVGHLIAHAVDENGVDRYFEHEHDFERDSDKAKRIAQRIASTLDAASFVEHATNSPHWRCCTYATRYVSPYSDETVLDDTYGAQRWKHATHTCGGTKLDELVLAVSR